MHIENLVKMANNICLFAQAEPNREVAKNFVADHLLKFWEPRMRDLIVSHCAKGGVGLSALAKEAITGLHRSTDYGNAG